MHRNAVSIRFKNTAPSGVNDNCFWLRSNSNIPSSDSSFLIATVMFGCDTFNRCAARVMFFKRLAI